MEALKERRISASEEEEDDEHRLMVEKVTERRNRNVQINEVAIS